MFKNINNDKTVNREYVKRIEAIIADYELIKEGKHPHWKFAADLFKAAKIPRQSFYKVYNRLQRNGSVLPGVRGCPRNIHNFSPEIEKTIVDLRNSGLNRFEIYKGLEFTLKDNPPSPTAIYYFLKKHNLNRLNPKQKQVRRMIIKALSGELGHIDLYHLPRGFIADGKKYYLVALIDDATRLIWADIIPDATSLTVMFAAMRIIRLLDSRYGIKFKEIMTDNGAEFTGKPFVTLLALLSIKHRRTKPYHPQTNGKIERFWRTIYVDLLQEATFKSAEAFRDELQKYLLYYNEFRPHSSLNNLTPKEFCNKICLRNV
jgi:hypothetical protein